MGEGVEENDYAGRTALWRDVELASGARVREATLRFRTALDREVVLTATSQLHGLLVCDGCEASADCVAAPEPTPGLVVGTVSAEQPFSLTFQSTSTDGEVRVRLGFAPP
ncbi:MAG TPA: hypothetical protein DEF51_05490 [Myxococcales bacterium]|nr:hypothetical protein [Myxococcales bacterium]